MATTFNEVVEEVQDIVVSGTSDAIVARWVNRRLREMVAKAQWRLSEEEIATTTADTATYDLTPSGLEVYELLGLKVDDAVYQPTSLRTGWDLTEGTVNRRAGAFLFTPSYGTDGTVEQVRLIPTPDSTGDSIVGLCSLYPDEVDDDDNLPIPDEFVHPLVRGIAAIVLAQDDEQQNEAAGHEAVFQQGISELSALKRRKTSPGPQSVPVQGYGFK